MEHYFDLPVTYNDEELLIKGCLVTFAYNYKLFVMVNGQELVFEKDNDGQYHILPNQPAQLNIEHGLLEAIITPLKDL